MRRFEFDPSWVVIKLLMAFRLVSLVGERGEAHRAAPPIGLPVHLIERQGPRSLVGADGVELGGAAERAPGASGASCWSPSGPGTASAVSRRSRAPAFPGRTSSVSGISAATASATQGRTRGWPGRSPLSSARTRTPGEAPEAPAWVPRYRARRTRRSWRSGTHTRPASIRVLMLEAKTEVFHKQQPRSNSRRPPPARASRRTGGSDRAVGPRPNSSPWGRRLACQVRQQQPAYRGSILMLTSWSSSAGFPRSSP